MLTFLEGSVAKHVVNSFFFFFFSPFEFNILFLSYYNSIDR